MGFVLLLLLSINPIEPGKVIIIRQILSSPPIEWPAVVSGRNSRDSITHRKTRYQLQIAVLRVFGHTPPGHRDPLSCLCRKKYTSTVRRVVMCVGDKGTVCRHLDEYCVYCMLHPVIVLLAPSLSCSHELRAKGYTSLDIRSERESNPAILGHQLHQRRLNYCFRGT